MIQPRFAIGIDPGKKTGFAVWDRKNKSFDQIVTTEIIDAMDRLTAYHADFEMYIEDARKRTWFGDSGREVLQGAGSIKRDCAIWEEFCEYNNISYVLVPPAANKTKIDGGTFRKLTGYKKVTSVHARDAAMLVFQR